MTSYKSFEDDKLGVVSAVRSLQETLLAFR